MKTLYEYTAVVKRVHDCTTLVVDIDLGFNITLREQYIVFDGIEVPLTPGHEEESKIASIDWLNDKLIYKTILIQTMKDPRNREDHWNALVYMSAIDEFDKEVDLCVNDELLKSGYARPKRM